jgi:signal peptidase II
MMKKRGVYVLLVLGVIVLDQLTKWLVLRALAIHDFRPVIDGFLSLSHVRNRGAAFGILSEADLPHQGILFSAISVLALGAIALYSLRTPAENRLPQVALALVMGGAVGNLIDRIRFGYVIDFVHVYWKSYQWWDFNVADSCISIGVALLVLDLIRSPGKDGAAKGIDGPAALAGRTE